MKQVRRSGRYDFQETRREFEEMHISLVWEELHERFGFPVKEWKKKFAAYFDQQSRQLPIVDAFFIFGNEQINPILNRILCRGEVYPTWNHFCEFVRTKKR